MLDFTAIDFETANSYRGSPCSVGLVRVRNGEITEQRHWLIRPPEGADWFSPWNIAINGIKPEQVQDAPRWKDVLPATVNFIGSDVVIAHNAGFDLGVMRYACAVDNIEWPEMRFLCTLVMARRALALPTYRLPYVAESLGCELDNHHDALADARAVVDVVGALASRRGVDCVSDLASSVGVRVGWMGSGTYNGSVSTADGSASLTPSAVNPNADPTGYLYGREIVFTGQLTSMTRQVAWDECFKVGALAARNTTKRTNVLVVGDINPASLSPGMNVTGKARKAFELQDKGQAIEVMTEDDFLRCLDGKPIDRSDASALTMQEHHVSDPVTSTLRSLPLQKRPAPVPPKPPRPLRRSPEATGQTCSTTDCRQPAAFKTRKKPTWCLQHIADIQLDAGLTALEPFTHPNDWQLSECTTCFVQAHYRLSYILDQNAVGIRTCRACYWRAVGRRTFASRKASTRTGR